jgi:hypothetical protein
MIRKSFLYFSALSGLCRRSGPCPDRRAYKGTHVRAGPDGDPRDEITRYALTLTHTPLAREARTRAQFHVACSDLRYRYYNQLILFPPVVLVSLISIRGLSRQVEAKTKKCFAPPWLCAGSACATSRTAERVHLQARNDPAPNHPAVCHPAPRQT